MKYEFIVASKVTAEANYNKGTSKLIDCEVKMFEPKNAVGLRKKNGHLTDNGLKMQTQALIQGLVANIHYGHQIGLWDSAAHLNYILNEVKRGFAYAGAEAELRKNRL
jgi:hypothetical protein